MTRKGLRTAGLIAVALFASRVAADAFVVTRAIRAPIIAQAPKPDDKQRYAEMHDMPIESLQFSEFTKSGYLDVDDALRPIYEAASENLGREFPYPGDE